MTFGEKIKSSREDKNYSQKYVAELIPMSQSSFSKIERNILEPNLYQLKRIVEILELDLNNLLDIKDDIKTETKQSTEINFANEIKSLYKKYFNKQ